MELFCWILFAVLIEIVIGIALGKFMKWSANEACQIDEPSQYDASEPYPRWYE